VPQGTFHVAGLRWAEGELQVKFQKGELGPDGRGFAHLFDLNGHVVDVPLERKTPREFSASIPIWQLKKWGFDPDNIEAVSLQPVAARGDGSDVQYEEPRRLPARVVAEKPPTHRFEEVAPPPLRKGRHGALELRPPDFYVRGLRAVVERRNQIDFATASNPEQAAKDLAAYELLADRWLKLGQLAKLSRKTDRTYAEQTAFDGLLAPGNATKVEAKIQDAIADALEPRPADAGWRMQALARYYVEEHPDEFARAAQSARSVDAYRLRGEYAAEAARFLETWGSRDDAEVLTRSQVEGSDMVRDRDLKTYDRRLPGLKNDLQSLSAGQTWLDVGGGTFHAAREYLESGGAGRVIGVDLGPTQGAADLQRDRGEQFRFLEGNVTQLDIGEQVDVITDLYGALSYDPHPDQVMNALGRALKPGGRLYLRFQQTDRGRWSDAPLNVVVEPEGRRTGLLEWLSRCAGFRVVSAQPGQYETSMVLERTSEEVAAPPVEEIGRIDTSPPWRILASTDWLSSG
jgi:SAM-dependent methyltransferase